MANDDRVVSRHLALAEGLERAAEPEGRRYER